MRIKEALDEVRYQHAILTNAPLVIEFSHGVALNHFLSALEKDIGMYAGELRMVRLRQGWDYDMYNGIEFRVKPRDHAKEAAKAFWEGYEGLAAVA